jgi:superfamily II DNA or RNA helicase
MLTIKDFSEEQNESIDHLFNFDETLFVAPKGFGKCPIAYTAITDLLREGHLSRVLILSTSQVCTEVWAKEATKWAQLSDDNFVCLAGKSIAQRKKLMEQETDIVICNFENLPWLMMEYDKLSFDGLLVDEITKLKTVGGVGFRKLRNKLPKFKWRVGMTADPVAQESVEIYGQMLIIDLGERLGRNKDNFKRKYFMQMDYAGYKWDAQPGGLERLTEVLKDVIYKVESDEYEQSLPELIENGIAVDLPPDVRKIYTTMARKNVVTIGDKEVLCPNEANLKAKLWQMCCGSVYQKDEFETKKTEIKLHDRKMEALDKLIKGYDTPFLIAYQFNFQKEAIVKKYGFPVYSASNNGKKNDALLKAWENGELGGMLIHPKSAGHGLNLQYGPCHRLVCMNYFWSADEWEQIIGRIRRRGQKARKVYRYVIYCTNTVEDCVMHPRLGIRKEKSDLFHQYVKALGKK